MDAIANGVGVETYIRLITPWFYIIMSLVSVVFGIWTRGINKRVTKIEDAVGLVETERTRRERELEDHCEKCKQGLLIAIKSANADILRTFQEGLKEEREFRLGVMKEQARNIEKIFQRQDELAILTAQIKVSFEASIQYQKQLCELRHGES